MRLAAAEELGPRGHAVVAELGEAVTSGPSPQVRQAAARALGELGDPGAVEPLAAALRVDTAPAVREAIVAALAMLGDRRAVEALAAALHDTETDQPLRKTIAAALGRLGHPPAVEALLIACGDPSRGVRVAARKALTGMGQGAVTQLIKALDHSSDRVRARAAEALGGLNNPRAVEPLEARRTDPELAVRAAVVEALVELGRKPEGHGSSRFEPYAASSYSWMRPPRRSRLRTPPRVLAGAGGSDGASGARRSSPRCGRLAL